MKAANMRAKQSGDDSSINRLLNLLAGSVPFKIIDIKKIRESVFYVNSEFKPFILKGYSSLNSLRLQESFTASLRKAGFKNSYLFYRFTKNPLILDKRYYGCIQYIDEHEDRFTYRTARNRQLGLNLLQQFHQTTAGLTQKYETIVHKNNLLEKWIDRKERFQKNVPKLKSFLHHDIIAELFDWADFALARMKTGNVDFGDKHPVILHGDVAHHNYLKGADGRLNLIDFDLISLGNPSSDLLQYANRILPYLNWSFDELAKLPQFSPFLKNRAFLAALIYPTDIFREWNRAIKERSYRSAKKLMSVMELTVDDYKLRQQFILDVKNMVK